MRMFVFNGNHYNVNQIVRVTKIFNTGNIKLPVFEIDLSNGVTLTIHHTEKYDSLLSWLINKPSDVKIFKINEKAS